MTQSHLAGNAWYVLPAACLYPYKYEDAMYHVGKVFAVTDHGDCFVWFTFYGMSHPPIRIEPPELAVQQPLAWRLVTDIEQLGGTILLVLVHRPIAGAGVGDSVPYMDRILMMEPVLQCELYQINGLKHDLCVAIWEPVNSLGQHSIFIGDSYPIVRRMPPSVHVALGLPFMKHGCVFTINRQLAI